MRYFEYVLAYRYLLGRKREGFLSIITWFSFIGIFLGVSTLIIVMSVMNGFDHNLIERIIGLNGHVILTSDVGPINHFDLIKKKISLQKGVRFVFPVINRQAMIMHGNNVLGGVIFGIRFHDLKNHKLLMDHLQKKNLSLFQKNNSIIIGQGMADRLNVNLGDEITLISPNGLITPFGSAPIAQNYKIIGIFHVGMYIYDNSYLYISLSSAQKIFSLNNSVTELQVIDNKPENSINLSYRLHNLFPYLQVTSWQDVNGDFFSAVKTERNVMFLILMLIILVAAFNIVAGQVLLVSNKEKSIAILRTIGASQKSIIRMFFITGSSIGVLGTFFGCFFGIFITKNLNIIRDNIEKFFGVDVFNAKIYFLTNIPSRISTVEVIFICFISLIITFIASLYPAWRASRLHPAKVLRYE